jgi:rubredoxin/uncharacterized membrane protein
MKKWECSICGYVHVGDEPPEECPKCGADRSKFVEISDQEQAPPEPRRSDPPPAVFDKFAETVWKLHIHPISVHIPNGVLPLSVFFICLAIFFRLESLGDAAFYNMIFVVLAMPVVLFSGYIDWKNRFSGNLTKLFMTKIICGSVVLISAALSVGWRVLDPNILTTSSGRWFFLLLHLVMLGAATVAGYCGGKLVFEKN